MKSLSLCRLFALLALACSVQAELLGPASRRTGWVISEIMYNPLPRQDGKDLEFIEIHNSEPWAEDISGYRLAGEIEFTFPPNTIVPALGFVVVAADPTAHTVQALGPWTGRLANEGGTIEFWSKSGGLFLQVDYNDRPPWPVSADGAGHSLVLSRPSYGQNEAKAWSASARIGGSPKALEPNVVAIVEPLVINEILSHTDDPQPDYLELFNRGATAINLTGYVLTDDPTLNRFVIGNITIPARSYIHFTQQDLGFALSAAGETIYLKDPNNTRVIDAVRFGAQENGVSFGRFPNGAPEFYRLTALTPGAANAPIRVSPVVINELMYHPISEEDDDQFIELHNTAATEADISGWRLEGGVDFVFPAETKIPAGGFIVIGRNRDRLLQNHPTLSPANTYGNYDGRLARSGERVALSMPEELVTIDPVSGATVTEIVFIDMDEVTYGDGGRWGQWADGGGSSLELIDPRSNHRLASNWADSDESAKAGWTTIDTTAVLDNGITSTADRFQMLLQDAGECLVDNIEVISQTGPNLVANGTFDAGIAGWSATGNHSGITWDSTTGFDGPGSIRIRATGRGDTGPNRIQHALSANMANQQLGTIRAKARWVRGSRELLLRVRSNQIEAIGTLNVPRNLGTPGAPNSRAASNTGPAIYDVKHSPILPAANQAIIVTARVEDPDAPSNVTLSYRIDPATTRTSVPMNDAGTGDDQVAADGIYTGRIPGQGTGAMVAFYVSAVDNSSRLSNFPADAPARECLVRVGEVQPAGSLGTYRIWMTAATLSQWSTRLKMDNSNLDVTFVYGNERVIYNAGARYAGSPYISPSYNSPTGNRCGYTGEFPKDDLFMGSTDLVLDWPGRDPTAIGEHLSYWIADQMGLPNSHRRFIHLHVNGVTDETRNSIFEDVQQPNGDFVEQWFPNDPDGNFFKIERAFEYNDAGSSGIADPMPHLYVYNTAGGAKKLAAYRWSWLQRAVKGSPNDYDDLFAFADAANAPGPEPYTSQALALADIDEMMGIFGVERIINNFDSWGHAIGKNMYIYKPPGGRWTTFMFDNDWLMDASAQHGFTATSDLFERSDDQTVARMYAHPPFRRAFFQQMKKAVDGPLAPEKLNPRADAMSAALTANNVTRSAGTTRTDATAVKRFLGDRRNYIITQLATVDAAFAITSNGGADFSSAENAVTLTGTAPIALKAIAVNGVSYPLSWPTVNGWSMRVPLLAANNVLNLQGVDYNGQTIPGATDSITVTFTGTVDAPAGKIVFSEIMYNPVVSGGGFVELQNISTTTTFDLSGWRVEGIDFVFPGGTLIAPGGFVVVANNRTVFISVYGNTVPVAGEFAGNLRNDGETLWLIEPGTPDEVIDEVTYSDRAPWPTLADGRGGSLQLIDATRDNSRAANWMAVEATVNNAPRTTLVPMTGTWKYNQTGTDLGTGWIANDYDDAAWPSGAALLYVEGAALPAAKNTPLTINRPTYYFRGRFNFSGDPSQVFLNLSTIVDDGAIVYLNGRELHRLGMPQGTVPYASYANRLVGDAAVEGPFAKPSTDLRVGENVIAAEVHQNNADSTDIVFGLSLVTEPAIIPASTPGRANSVARPLPEFPNLWINEVLPVNVTGIADEFGQRDPWIELHNGGPTAISLAGWHLTDTTTDLMKWAFPAGARIEPGTFVKVWLDAQPVATTDAVFHASFRAAPQSGMIALVFPFEGSNAVLDYATYANLPNDRSFGRYPDGGAGTSQLFFVSTPGAPNDNTAPTLPLFINEWLASNQTIADPSDGDFDDWFEIYNPNDVDVDLVGYYLTDNIADPLSRWRIPRMIVAPAHGFVLIWADDENPIAANELHVPFKLAAAGETIGLYAPNGTLVDSITFGAQANNVSQGRYPDGAETWRTFARPTPRVSNLGQNSEDLRIDAVTMDAAGNVTIQWASQPGLTYRVQYKRNLSDPLWSDLRDVPSGGATTGTADSAGSETQRFYRIVLGAP